MAYDLAHEDGLLRVTYSGVVTVAERTRAITEAFAAGAATGTRRVLVDFRGVSATPPAMDFETSKRFVDVLAKSIKGGSDRVAYLTEFDLPIDRCIELMIESRRLPIRRFMEEATAVSWLSN